VNKGENGLEEREKERGTGDSGGIGEHSGRWGEEIRLASCEGIYLRNSTRLLTLSFIPFI